MIRIVDTTLKRIRISPMVSSFLLLGLVISMLMISFSTSYVAELQNIQRNKEKNAPPNAQMFTLSLNNDNSLSMNDITNILSSVSKNTGVILNNILVNIDNSGVSNYYSVSGEWFLGETEWNYSLVEGRYYTVEEVNKGLKVALIGKDLEKYADYKNGSRYIKIYGEEYEVVGLVGSKDEKSLWDTRIFMPVPSLPKLIKEKLAGGNLSIIVYNRNGSTINEIQNILNSAKVNWKSAEVSNISEIQVEDVAEKLAGNMDLLLGVGVLVYIVSIINAINIVSFWIEQRRFEIGVRKAFGHNNLRISLLLFSEMFGISVIACLLALAIQFIIGLYANNIMGYTIKLYFQNIITASIAVIVTSLLTSVIPIMRSLKMQPTESMKL